MTQAASKNAGTRNIEANVAALEADVNSLRGGMSALERKTDANHEAVMVQLDRLTRSQTESQRLNPGWVAVALTIVGLASALIGSQISGLKKDLDQHSGLEGHAQTRIDMTANTGSIATLREGQIDNASRVQRLFDVLDDRREWMMENSNIDATQSEKIGELEREHSRYRDGLELIQANRWTSDEGLANRDRIAQIEAEQARMDARLDVLDALQRREP